MKRTFWFPVAAGLAPALGDREGRPYVRRVAPVGQFVYSCLIRGRPVTRAVGAHLRVRPRRPGKGRRLTQKNADWAENMVAPESPFRRGRGR